MAGSVAPVTKTVTYNTITNIPGEPSKCWITRNLGADHESTAFDDDTEPSAGWYWQFNHKQGYKHDGTTLTPKNTWITNPDVSTDWKAANDPCTLELGNGWRIPTSSEWDHVLFDLAWVSGNPKGLWNSGLKVHTAGHLDSDGSLINRGIEGNYCGNSNSYTFLFKKNLMQIGTVNSAYGYPLRCIKD